MFYRPFQSYWRATYRWWTTVSALLCPYTSYRLHVGGKSRSSVKTEPWEMSKWYRWGSWSNYSSITQNDIWKNFRSETVFHCATRKLVKQSYLQVVFWCLFGFSNPINNVRSPQQSQTHSSNRPTSRQLDWFTIFREHCWKCGSEFCQVIKIKKRGKDERGLNFLLYMSYSLQCNLATGGIQLWGAVFHPERREVLQMDNHMSFLVYSLARIV